MCRVLAPGGLQGCEEAGHEAGALGEAFDQEVLLEGVAAGAEDAEAVEGGDAHGAGEVAVRAAAGAAVGEGEADFAGQGLGLGVEGEHVRVGFQTGRVTWRVTVNWTSFWRPPRASMR